MGNDKNTDSEGKEDINEELLEAIVRLKFALAHHVRAPIVSASGLVVLLSSQNISDEEKSKTLAMLLFTINDMDLYTRHMMAILTQLEKTIAGKN